MAESHGSIWCREKFAQAEACATLLVYLFKNFATPRFMSSVPRASAFIEAAYSRPACSDIPPVAASSDFVSAIAEVELFDICIA